MPYRGAATYRVCMCLDSYTALDIPPRFSGVSYTVLNAPLGQARSSKSVERGMRQPADENRTRSMIRRGEDAWIG